MHKICSYFLTLTHDKSKTVTLIRGLSIPEPLCIAVLWSLEIMVRDFAIDWGVLISMGIIIAQVQRPSCKAKLSETKLAQLTYYTTEKP